MPFRVQPGPRHVPNGSNLTQVQGSAVISEDGLYRYRLDRWWGDGPRVAWVMLNPSTADADVDDPTIRRCVAFTKAWGYEGLTVVNLWPFRATKPEMLLGWFAEAQGDSDGALAHRRNVVDVLRLQEESPLVVCAWGAWPKAHGVLPWVRRDTPTYHLGLTRDGSPRHPLYVRSDTKPIPWVAPPTADMKAGE